MGVDFRSGSYVRFVRFGHRTVKDGEAVVIWDLQGKQTEVIGPRRVTLWFSTIRFLDYFKATFGQYLRVQFRNGTISHKVGPTALYLNPTKHESIQVMNACHLISKDDCVIVYDHHHHGANNTFVPSNDSPLVESKDKKNTTKDGSMVSSSHPNYRKIIYGPRFFIPSKQESIHTFTWTTPCSSTVTENGGNDQGGEILSSKQPESFQVLQTHQTKLWKLCLPLRTQEGPLVTVQLVMSYQIESVDKCMVVADPIVHVLSALKADAANSSSSQDDKDQNNQISVDNNISVSARQLSHYPIFQKAMQGCGFRILEIYVNDVTFPKQVTEQRQREAQELERQTKATARLQQGMELAKLEYDQKRSEAKAQAALEQLQNELQAQVAEQGHAVQTTVLQNELRLEKLRIDAQLEATQKANQVRLEYWQGLAELNVDLTRVLTCHHATAAMSGTVAGGAVVFPEEKLETSMTQREEDEGVKTLDTEWVTLPTAVSPKNQSSSSNTNLMRKKDILDSEWNTTCFPPGVTKSSSKFF